MGRVRDERRLRAKDIATLGPGIHEDGGGLRLVVEAGGSRHWVQRLTVAGKRHSRGLGSWPVVTLDDARDQGLDLGGWRAAGASSGRPGWSPSGMPSRHISRSGGRV